jgi:hypothetical protein
VANVDLFRLDDLIRDHEIWQMDVGFWWIPRQVSDVYSMCPAHRLSLSSFTRRPIHSLKMPLLPDSENVLVPLSPKSDVGHFRSHPRSILILYNSMFFLFGLTSRVFFLWFWSSNTLRLMTMYPADVRFHSEQTWQTPCSL